MPEPVRSAGETRLSRVREALERLGLDAFLVTNGKNIRYLSGFSGSSAVALVTPAGAWLVTDFRYRLQAAREVRDFETVEQNGGTDRFLTGFLGGFGFRRMGFEASASFGFVRKLRVMIRPGKARPVDGLVEKTRMVKEPPEIEAMERMIEVCRTAFDAFLAWVRPGVTEREAALELEYRLRGLGSDLPPFPIIVAAGENSAMPHAQTTGRAICEGEPVIVDFGAATGGYATDLTRTFCLGEPSPDIAKIYRLVYDAQESAIRAIRPGVRGSEVDRAARERIATAGMGDLFGHATGHGVGLDVHEAPGLSPESRDILRPNMVVTVEPGIYVAERGGIRLEDMVLVTGDGHRVLSAGLPKPERLGL